MKKNELDVSVLKKFIFLHRLKKKTKGTDPWCNWQHVWFWSRRVQVRALAGQPKKPRFIPGFFNNIDYQSSG